MTAVSIAQPQRTAGTVPARINPPAEFGTADYMVTVIPATSFVPNFTHPECRYITDYGSLARYFPSGACAPAYEASVNIPSGVIIDYVGLEAASTGQAELSLDFYRADRDGTVDTIVTLDNTPHGFATDYNPTALGFQFTRNVHNMLRLFVSQAQGTLPLFGWVEIWWRRAVSPAPATPTFGDVPSDDFGYQYVEALSASSVTSGCGNGDYCPDRNVTRREMAIFLSKALGLHWVD
jgi:hypothetical protein